MRNAKDEDLVSAVRSNKAPEAVKAIREGADPNACSGNAPLIYIAAGTGKAELTNILLAAGADPNALHLQDSSSPLMAAAAHWDAAESGPVVSSLLMNGASLSAKCSRGMTALDHAREAKNKSSIHLLLRAEQAEQRIADGPKGGTGIGSWTVLVALF